MPLRDSSEVAARPCRGPGHQQQRRNSSAGRRKAQAAGIPRLNSARMWWQTLHTDAAAADLAELALVLLEVVPHAATPERVFSTMGWYESGKAARLSVGTNAQKTAIKMHYDSYKLQAPSR